MQRHLWTKVQTKLGQNLCIAIWRLTQQGLNFENLKKIKCILHCVVFQTEIILKLQIDATKETSKVPEQEVWNTA